MDAAEAQAFLPVTNEFLDAMVRLRPRVAAFDCDGTLWSGDAGERFFDWELRQRDIVSAALDRPMREGTPRTSVAKSMKQPCAAKW